MMKTRAAWGFTFFFSRVRGWGDEEVTMYELCICLSYMECRRCVGHRPV